MKILMSDQATWKLPAVALNYAKFEIKKIHFYG